MLPPAVTNAIGIFIAVAFVTPLLNRYQAWKHDPQRERVYRRNWRGVFVPDLIIIRTERGLWTAFALFVMLGLAINWVIMTS